MSTDFQLGKSLQVILFFGFKDAFFFWRVEFFGQVSKPSKVEIFEEDEILVMEFAESLTIGVGVLTIEFAGILNDKMKGFYRR